MPKKARGIPANSAAVRRGTELAEAAKAELRGEIHRRRLVAADLARDLGHTRTFLSNLFSDRGDKKPSSIRLETVLTLLELLDIDPGDFFSRVARTGTQPVRQAVDIEPGQLPVGLTRAVCKARGTIAETVLHRGLKPETADELGEVAADLILGLHRILSLALASSEMKDG